MVFKAFIIFLSVLCLAACIGSSAEAENYAVLIGINDYPGDAVLYGPVNDVRAMRDTLERYAFQQRNIKVLLNEGASKEGIIKALSDLRYTTSPGDFIVVYFSGHGTSSFDSNMRLSMGDATGAVIPYDFDPSPEDPQKTLNSMIIGKRDLRPIFAELDRDRSLFVVFDSCYSGNAVRSVSRMAKGKPKFMPVQFLGTAPSYTGKAKEPYPYKNIIYMSAADDHEMARDLRAQDGTHDGKAHGAFTDMLLQGLSGAADTNHDGVITYEELYHFTKKRVNEKVSHTPQLLHNDGTPISTPVFGSRPIVREPAGTEEETQRTTRLKIISSQSSDKKSQVAGIRERLRMIKGLQEVEQGYDLLIVEESAGFSFYLPGSDKLCWMPNADDAALRVERFRESAKLIAMANREQKFNVWLTVGEEGRTTYFEGEKIGAAIRSEMNASLLLINIDAMGFATVLLPAEKANLLKVSAGKTVIMPEIGQIEEPLGTEYMKLIAFREDQLAFKKFSGKTLDTRGAEFRELLDIIQRQKEWAETMVQIVSVKGPKK